MNFDTVDDQQISLLMLAGGIFAFIGLWMMFRPKTDGHAAKIELFGLKFESSSAGLLVFLIGSGFLAAPVFMTEKNETTPVVANPILQANNQTFEEAPVLEKPVDPTEWEPIGQDTFDSDRTDWFIGEQTSETIARQTFSLFANRYRWDFDFAEPRSRSIEAPYPPAIEFYLAVTFNFVSDISENSTAVGLTFGKSGEREFRFFMSESKKDRYYSLEVRQKIGEKPTSLITWTPVPSSIQKPDRLSVVVTDSVVRMFINDVFVGDYQMEGFLGGKVGLVAYSWEAGTKVFDFDNFEYRRAPEDRR